MSAHTSYWLGTPTRDRFQSKAGFRRRKISNAVLLTITGLFTLLALLPLFWIIAYVVYKGGQYINLDFFIHLPAPLGVFGGGVLNAIEGTLVLTVLASLFAVPPGLLAAFYVAYKPNTLIGILVRFGTDVLSGVPSIIIGVLSYAVIVKTLGHFSALAGGVALAILMLPTIIRTTEEMIHLVPHSMREGALALGSPEWKTALSITLPAASQGIITGILLGIARASGETAPLLFTALGNENYSIGGIIQSGVANHQGFLSILGNIINQPVDSLPLTLWKYAQQPYPERVNQAWAVALVLMVVVLSINILTRLWVQRSSRRMQGK
jgi:phosphate transport system permease protein